MRYRRPISARVRTKPQQQAAVPIPGGCRADWGHFRHTRESRGVGFRTAFVSLLLFFFLSFFFFAVSSFVSSFGRSGFFLGVVQVPRCRDFCAPDFRRFFFVFFLPLFFSFSRPFFVFCLRLPMAGRRAVPSRCRCRKKNNTGNR